MSLESCHFTLHFQAVRLEVSIFSHIRRGDDILGAIKRSEPYVTYLNGVLSLFRIATSTLQHLCALGSIQWSRVRLTLDNLCTLHWYGNCALG